LSLYSLANKNESEWIEDILHKAYRYWLFPPKCVRDAEEPLRQAWIVERQRQAEIAREAQRRAEEQRLLRVAEQHEREEQEKAAEHVRQLEREAARSAEEQLREQRESTRIAEELRQIRERAAQAAEQEHQLIRAARIAQDRAKSAPGEMQRSALLRALQNHEEIAKDRAPDLQALMTAHGGYNRITPEAWDKYDQELEAWKQRSRERHLVHKPRRDDPANWFPFDNDSNEACFECGKEAHFGYHGGDRLVWFCAEHRLAVYWADARC
jgi:hypothetical protein